ncbi:hypothetical protein KY285_032462 [Solanum tuberosum]|nr:hypothetical protein KY285_032462 [Solanum tuberosum]
MDDFDQFDVLETLRVSIPHPQGQPCAATAATATALLQRRGRRKAACCCTRHAFSHAVSFP